MCLEQNVNNVTRGDNMRLTTINPFFTRVVYVWALVLTAMCVYAVVWFVNLFWLWEVFDAIESAYTFTEPATTTITLIKTLVLYNPIIALFGWIIYGYVNSTRRDTRSYETYG